MQLTSAHPDLGATLRPTRKGSEPSQIPEDDHWKRIGVIETNLAMRNQGKSGGCRGLL
jgi:hypothetical protein